jgi:hypothetical protein
MTLIEFASGICDGFQTSPEYAVEGTKISGSPVPCDS